MEMPFEGSLPPGGSNQKPETDPNDDNQFNHLPTWDEALRRFQKLRPKFKEEVANHRIKALALLWLGFQHKFAHVIAESPLFIRPQISEAGDKNLLRRLLHQIPHTPERSWLIEGDAGMGKTTFCQHLCHVHWKMYLAGLQERIPFYIYMLDVNEHSAQNYVKAALSGQYERIRQQLLPPGITLDESDYAWVIQQPLLLILDGFDEVRVKKNYYDENRWDETSLGYNIKVVYGCRPEALGETDRLKWFAAPRGPGQERTYQRYALENLTPQQINDYIVAYSRLKVKVTGLTVDWYTSWLRKLLGVEEIIEVPQLLRIVLDILPAIVNDIENNANTPIQQHLTRWRVYETFVKMCIQDQATRIRREGHLNQGGLLNDLKGSLEGYLFSYISNLAYTRWSDNLGHINNQSLSPDVTLRLELMEPQYCGSIESFQGVSEKGLQAEAEYRQLLQYYHDCDKDKVFSKRADNGAIVPNTDAIKLVRSGTLFKVDDQSYRFIHKTIIEYLTMGSMTYNLRNQFAQFLHSVDSIHLDKKRRFDINVQSIRDEPNMIGAFVKQFNDVEVVRNLLYDILYSSKTILGVDLAASNAITLLNAMGENFSNKDFSDVQIPGADLRKSICDSTNFRGANLADVWFNGAWLRNANFLGANLDKVLLGEANILTHDSRVVEVSHYVPSDSDNENESYWLVGCENGIIYQWSTSTLTIVREYKVGAFFYSLIGECTVRYIGVHNNSDLLVAKSWQNDIILWSLKTGKHINTIKDSSQASKIALSPDGKFIAYLCPQWLRIWSVTDEKCINDCSEFSDQTPLQFFTGTGPKKTRIKDIHCFNVASDWLLVEFKDEEGLSLIRTASQYGYREILKDQNTQNLSNLTFGPNDEILAVGYEKGKLILWSVERKCIELVIQDNLERILNVSFNSEGNFLYYSYWLKNDNRTFFAGVDLLKRKLIFTATLPYHVNTVIKHSSNSNPIAYWGYSDKIVYLTSLEALTLSQVAQSTYMRALGSKNRICDIISDANGAYCASWDRNNRIIIIATKTGECVHTFTEHKAEVIGLAFSSNGKWLASWNIEGQVLLCSMNMLGQVRYFKAHDKSIKALEFSNNSQLFVTYGVNKGFFNDWKSAKLWSIDGKCLKQEENCMRVNFHNHDSIVAWSYSRGVSIQPFDRGNYNYALWKNFHNIPLDYVLSSDGAFLAAVSTENLRIWSLTDVTEHKICDMHIYPNAGHLMFLDNNKRLAFITGYQLVTISIETNNLTKRKLSAKCHSCLNINDNYLLIGYDNSVIDKNTVTKVELVSIRDEFPIKSFIINHSVHTYRLLFGSTMLLAQGENSFSLIDLNTQKYVLGLDLAVKIGRIQWLEAESRVLVMLGEVYKDDYLSCISSVLCFSYHDIIDVHWNLVWSRGALPTNWNGINLLQSLNVSTSNLALLKRHGAFGNPAPALSEICYTPLNRLIVPLPNTSQNGLRPPCVETRGLNLAISADIWVVSVARKNNTSQHVFLVLEGVVNYRRFVLKAHLTTQKNTAIINFEVVDNEKYTLDKFVESVKNYEAQSWEITQEQGLLLIDNIRSDQCTTMSYRLLGDQGGKRDALGNEYHSCVTWCKKQLRQISISLSDQWYNCLVTLLQDVLKPPAAQESSNTDHSSPASPTTSLPSNRFASNFFQNRSGYGCNSSQSVPCDLGKGANSNN